MQEPTEPTGPATGPGTQNPFVIERTVAHELLDRLVSELRQQRRPWMTYTEDEQRDAIERLRKAVEDGVDALTHVIVAGKRQALTADVERVTFANSVRALLSLPRGSPLVHELADHAGAQIVLVLVDPKQYTDGLGDVKPDVAQIDLLKDGEAHD